MSGFDVSKNLETACYAGASGPSYLPDATKLWYDGGRVN